MSMRRACLSFRCPLLLSLLVGLAACGGGGGGGSSSSSASVSSRATAQSVSANSAVLPSDSTEAASIALATAKVAVAGSCVGGGTASVSVTGGTPASRANGVFDTGEVYAFNFAQCRSASGAAAVNGAMTLTVVATSPSLVVNTTTNNLSVALPQRTVTLNGSSTITQSATSSGNTVTTSTRWTSNTVHVDSARPRGTTRYELRNVNLLRTIDTVNGQPVRSSCEGTSTLDANFAFFTWFITLATLGPINYGPTGAVVSGTWLIDLPDDRIRLDITPLTLTVAVDLGANGSNDLVFFFDFADFFDEAG